jgi:hypothetical protein
MSMRFSWTGLLLAPLVVPALFSLVLMNFSSIGAAILSFLVTTVLGCIISYGTTIFLFLPGLFLVSRCRPMTGFSVCVLGAVLGMAVYLPVTFVAWGSSGIDSGPPEESFFMFLLRWAADPMAAIFPFAGLVTAGTYWWLGGRRWKSRAPAVAP